MRRTLLALMPLCFRERRGTVNMVAASTEAGQTARTTTAACATMHNTTMDHSVAVYCWWIFHMSAFRWFSWLCSTCACTCSRSPKDAEGWRLQHAAQTLWKTDFWAVERRSLGAESRETSKTWCPQSTTTSEQTFCLQTCGQEACCRCNTAPTMTRLQLRLAMCTRHVVLYARLVDVETAVRTRQTHMSNARPCHS